MNFSLKKLIAYCKAHTTPQSEILYQLERETYLKTLSPQMMSGHLQGQLLSFISQMIQPKIALEIGTFTGYAAICIAKGLPKGSVLHTIEVKEELEFLIRKYIKKSGFEDIVKLHIGKAEDIIPSLPKPFDLVFIDAGKRDYATHYDLVIDSVQSGGIILADNVLWSGKVTQEKRDKDTQILHAFNEKVQQDSRVENIVLPIRDGLMIARKI